MSLAWHVAAMIRSDPKKFPKLRRLLISAGAKPRREMTPDEQWRVMSSIATSTSKH